MSLSAYPYLACVLLSACSIQKDLLTAGQQDTDSSSTDPVLTGTEVTASVTSDSPPTTAPGPDPTSTTSAPEDETGDALPPGCMLLPGNGESYISPQTAANLDEDCTVAAVDAVADGVELALDCPQHAAEHDGLQPHFTILAGGPTPTPAPIVGETLSVFFTREDDGGDFGLPDRELLFLRRADHLLYATMHGKAYEDPAQLPALFAPLLMTTPMSACPFTPSDEFSDSTGGPPDGFDCFFGAVAELHLGFADDPPLVLTEGNDGALQAGDRSYAVDLRRAQISEGCVDDPDRRIVTLAVALQ